MSDSNEPRVYNCPKVTNPPIIDGKLDDEAWAQAPVIKFVLSETGEPATKGTEARMCWDDTNLYISFECMDEDIWGTLLNRGDHIFTEEVVEAFLCPTGDLNRYFEFNVSPRNTVFEADLQLIDGKHPGPDNLGNWRCEGIRTAVVVDGTLDDRTDIDRAWTVEISIPFASLGRETPRPGEEWRGNLYRIDRSPLPVEHQAWSPTLVTPAAFHVPEKFGTIIFRD